MQVKDFLKLGSPIPLEVYRLSVENAYNQIIITDIDGIILYANKGLARITGYTPEEVIGKTAKLWGGLMPAQYYQDMWTTIRTQKQPFFGEVKNKKKSGEEYWAIVAISPILDYNNNLAGYIGTEEDATLYHAIKDKLSGHVASQT